MYGVTVLPQSALSANVLIAGKAIDMFALVDYFTWLFHEHRSYSKRHSLLGYCVPRPISGSSAGKSRSPADSAKPKRVNLNPEDAKNSMLSHRESFSVNK